MKQIQESVKKIQQIAAAHPVVFGCIVFALALSMFFKVEEALVGERDEFPGSDAHSYNMNAVAFVNEGEPISTYFNPLQTIYLVAVYSIFDTNMLLARIIQILASFAIPFFLYHAAKKFFGSTAGVIAILFGSLHPFIIYYSAHFWSEFWIMVILSAMMYLYAQSIGKKHISYKTYFLFGALGALGALGKVWVLLAAGAFVFFLLLEEFKWRISPLLIKKGLTAVAGVFLLLLPWTVYATTTAGYFVLINENSETNLYIGNHPEPEIAYTSRPYNFDYAREMEISEGSCDVLMDMTDDPKYRYYLRKCTGSYAISYMLSNPGQTMHKIYQFTVNYWLFPNLQFFQRHIQNPSSLLKQLWFFWILAAIGFLLSLQRWRYLLPFYAAVLIVWFTHAIVFYLARYKAGLVPLTVFFASGAVAILYLIMKNIILNSMKDGTAKKSLHETKKI